MANPSSAPPLFQQMTICGVGLIGGSLGAIARGKRLANRVVGLGRGEANLTLALERGLIDAATRDPAEAADGADLVVLATPIRRMAPVLRAMIAALPEHAIISDAGSVKEAVIRELEPILGARMALVGAHPVAGKETTGAAAANADLFAGHRVIITPSARSTPAAVSKIEMLWRAAGARVETMTPEMHDRILARASHLPQIVSTALAAGLGRTAEGTRAAGYGAGGLRDMTRLAASSAEMWVDICLMNRGAIVTALAEYRDALEEFSALMRNADEAGLMKFFERGRALRAELERTAGK
ncbi:MAG: prephenate dehydrogenase [Candidatus Binataceae bacterium]